MTLFMGRPNITEIFEVKYARDTVGDKNKWTCN